MSELDRIVEDVVRERLGQDAELALQLYRAYRAGGRRAVLELIRRLAREASMGVVEVGEGEG